MEQALVSLIHTFCQYVCPETEQVALHLRSLELDNADLQRILIKVLETPTITPLFNTCAGHLVPMPPGVDLGEEVVFQLLNNYSDQHTFNLEFLAASNGHHFRKYLKLNPHRLGVYNVYRKWAIEHDEWESE